MAPQDEKDTIPSTIVIPRTDISFCTECNINHYSVKIKICCLCEIVQCMYIHGENIMQICGDCGSGNLCIDCMAFASCRDHTTILFSGI